MGERAEALTPDQVGVFGGRGDVDEGRGVRRWGGRIRGKVRREGWKSRG